jgi:hypothetical protein
MRILAIFVFFLIGNLSFAQVQIVAEQDQDRNLTLLAFNNEKIPYTIRIEFLKLENLESFDGRVIYAVANPGKTNLVKLRSIYVNDKTGFNYNTKLYKGNYEPNDLEMPDYLLPVQEGTILSMRPLTSKAPQDPKNPKSQAYTGAGFFFEKPTTICAPRKGIVSEIRMDSEEGITGVSSFDSENFVEIYHQDGSFSRLTGLKANSAKVSLGEVVFPGQAIGESSFFTLEKMHHVKMIQSRWEMDDFGMIWVNFPVSLFSDQQNVQSDEINMALKSIHDADLILMEMDKKERKKYLTN